MIGANAIEETEVMGRMAMFTISADGSSTVTAWVEDVKETHQKQVHKQYQKIQKHQQQYHFQLQVMIKRQYQ